MRPLRAEPSSALGRLRPLGPRVLGGLAASLCCVPAAVAFALGLGGSAFLVGLGLYKLPFMGLGIVITGLAAWALTRCRDSACQGFGQSSLTKAVVLVVAGFALAYLGLVYGLVPLLYQAGLER